VKPLFVRVELFDPLTEEAFPVHEGISVSVARLDRETRRVDLDRLPLAWDEGRRCFAVDAPDYRVRRGHHLVVTFAKRNFSKSRGRLLDLEEARATDERLYAPSRVPDWDSGWDDAYRRAEYFGFRGRQRRTSERRPIVLRVPVRRLYVVGHRGAPHRFPENTLAAFRTALDEGANGIEFDLCLLRDGRIAVFHDAQPVKQSLLGDRTRFESLPYELVSPTFGLDGRTMRLFAVEGGRVVARGERRLASRRDADLVNLTYEEARDIYRYAPVEGQEHRILDLDAFLAFAAEEADRLRLLFFDVKPPGRLSDPGPALEYGRRIGEALRRHPSLPERMVVGYADAKVLKRLRDGIRATGEDRCWFAFDAAGGVAALLQGFARGWAFLPSFLRRWLGWILPGVPDPLAVARRLRNPVVSIGKLARPAHLQEIRRAVRDRDYRPRSPIEMVIHWTLNDAEHYAQSVESGVNAILTDKPGALVEHLAERGLRVS